MRKLFLFITVFLSMMLAASAKNPGDTTKLKSYNEVTENSEEDIMAYITLMDSVNKAMKWETGTITLPSAVVKLNVPAGFKYLGVEQSRYVIEKLWGNLPQKELEGMLFPEDKDPFSDSSYAYIISYSPVGHIKDGDAKDINYTDLLEEMKKDEMQANIQRRAAGLDAMYLQDWAAAPYYDEQKKVLHWATSYSIEGETDDNTLNYTIILLGRKGMLSMNAVSSMKMLPLVKADVNKVLGMAEYTTGNRYQDFDSNVDEVAAWTVGGLVAGKVLLKTAAGVGILKFLKFIIAGIVIAGGAIWRFVSGRKKKEEEFVYQPAPNTTPDQGTGNPQ